MATSGWPACRWWRGWSRNCAVRRPRRQRIELEGLFAGVRDAAVDLAARREMLLGRLKARIAAGRLDEAKPLLKELRRLPSAQDLVALRASELKKDLSGTAASQAKIDAVLR